MGKKSNLFHKLKRSFFVAVKCGRADVKSFRQRRYIDFDERIAVDGVLQDELAGGVEDADGLDVAVGVGEAQLIGGRIRIDAELQRVVVVDADVGSIDLVEIGNAVAELGVGVVVKVAAFTDHLHDLRGGVAWHGLPQAGAHTGGHRGGQTRSVGGR